MKTLQKILMFYILSASCILHAQNNQRKGWDGVVKGGSFSIGYNNTMINSTTKEAYVLNSLGINADAFFPFSLFRKGWDGTVKGGSFGFNIGGTYNFGASGDPEVQLPNALNIIGQTASTVAYNTSNSQQTGFRIGGGPQVNFNFSERFIFSPMVLAEYFSMTQNELSVIQTSEINGKPKEYTLWTLPETKTNGLAITPKVRLQYFFSKNFGVFADGAYVFGPKINTQFTTLVPLGKTNQEGQYEQQQVDLGTKITGDVIQTSYNAFSASVGLSYSFGGNKVKKPKDVEQISDVVDFNNCDEKIKLVYPNSSKRFILEDKEFPKEFSWQKSEFKKVEYIFNLFKGGALLFTKKTKNNFVETRDFQEKLVLDKEKIDYEYSWNVTVINAECENYTTNSNSFGLRSSTSPTVEIVSVTCKSPAYDRNGKVNYELKFKVYYNSTNLKWRINNFNIYSFNNSSIATLITPVTLIGPTLPITLTSSSLATDYTVNIAVPLGTSGIDVKAIGQILNSSNVVQTHLDGNDQDRMEPIDNCICNFCDDIRIRVSQTGNGGNFISLPDNDSDAFLANHTLNVSSSSGPVNVVAVDVEIIAYEHYGLSSEQCIACNNKKSQHGTFFNYAVGNVNQSNLITGNFLTSQAMYNNPLGPSGRSIRWQSATQNGTMINNIQTKLAIGIPKLINSCCSDCFNMAFRYTFTIRDPKTGECRKCSKVIVMRQRCRDGKDHPNTGNPGPTKPDFPFETKSTVNSKDLPINLN